MYNMSNNDSEYVYVFIYGMDWEDTVIILSKEDAIETSKKYPNSRVEIFSKSKNVDKGLINSLGYTATYNYYKNGELVLFY
uniref:Uncharacterized protein n=1 Tax=viral metagenome TaxID=1070528 RepID=A0A6C0EG95_9ZZZZ